MVNKQVETKVIAAVPGALTGLVLGEFLLWLVEQWWFGGGDAPEPVAQFVVAASVTVFAFLAPYLAPHTRRDE